MYRQTNQSHKLHQSNPSTGYMNLNLNLEIKQSRQHFLFKSHPIPKILKKNSNDIEIETQQQIN